MNELIILIDNGHGIDTPGKRSPQWPDGSQLLEWEFTRDIARRLSRLLAMREIPCQLIVPEIEDISLKERCSRINNAIHYNTVYCGRACLLISIHANAGKGTGWECFTTKGDTLSDSAATLFYESAKVYFPGQKIRTDFSDGDADKEENFYILQHTKCPAVLTENFFMDTEKDCKLLMQEDFRQEIADMHLDAIVNLIKAHYS